MSTFTSHQLEKFFKKSEKFFNSHYPILHDDNGLLTKLDIENASGKITYSLIHGVDRHHLICNIAQDLINIMCFESAEANQIAFYYVDLKYKEYCNYIMNL
jgi:hypothetical protein